MFVVKSIFKRARQSKKESLQSLLKPCPSSWLTAVEVSPLLNSAKNNRPEVLPAAVTDLVSTKVFSDLIDRGGLRHGTCPGYRQHLHLASANVHFYFAVEIVCIRRVG